MVEWREIQNSAQLLHYKSNYGNNLYIRDNHRGCLDKTGERYHLIYSNPGEYSSNLKTCDDLEKLTELVEDVLGDIERTTGEGDR